MIENPRHFPEHKLFEEIHIQWDKSVWKFPNGNLDSYSIWNPNHHQEIAERLVAGQRCALYMMGNFGVGEFFQEGSKNFDILDKVKQRERVQNLLAFANPQDIGDFIDFDRLPDNFKGLSNPKQRLALYPGPMHAIFPIKKESLPYLGLIREADTSTAFFWMPGHSGYEKLTEEIKKRAKGLFGGGSLNIHGATPSFRTVELKSQFAKTPQWVENIDFVILDEISESFGIGRSHTQVSFMQETPEIIRIGSLSKGNIERHLGKPVEMKNGVKPASSTTPYDDEHNVSIDQKVEQAFEKMQRFEQALKKGQFT